jgi:N-acyl-D-aspartate/D-glutamate deacylase
LEGVIAASDGMAAVYGGWDQLPWDTAYEDLPNTHPRVAGTHGKSLRLARENGIPLMHVLATFSYYPAKYLGATGLKAMQERGRLQEGMVADITLIDPYNVTDNATYDKGTLPTTGLPYVLVNGAIVVKDSKVLPDVYPGQPIRFPVEDKGRHETLTAEAWRAEYMVPSTGFHSLDSLTP